MGFRTLCFETRCRCSYEGGYLVHTTRDQTTKIHLSEITSVMFCTPQAYVSAYLLAQFAQQKIPVVFCDENYLPVSQSLPLYGTYNCAERFRAQLEWKPVGKKQVWQRIIKEKIRHQAEVLGYFGAEQPESTLRGYLHDVRSGDSSNREAAAASLYFPVLFGHGFTRDQDNVVNAQLNYGYSIILSRVSREIVAQGCSTQLGICHQSRVNEWNLSCDIMEPFRPFVDRFVAEAGADELSTDMKHQLINLPNHYVRYREGEYKLASTISMFVKDCLDALDGKAAASEIEGYEFVE